MSQPQAVLIAGPNGAGKTTFARQALPLLQPGVAFINADEIQRQPGGYDSPIAAAREFVRRLDVIVKSGESFAVETTLASRTYLARILRWRQAGYRTVLHFIELPSADFAVARVAQRAANGGHGIPEQDIRRRFARGWELFDGVYKTAVHEWHHWYSDAQGIRLLTPMTREQKRELLLEAARRANWDAMHGPMHLRTGRFFVSQVHAAHAFTKLIGNGKNSSNSSSVESKPGAK